MKFYSFWIIVVGSFLFVSGSALSDSVQKSPGISKEGFGINLGPGVISACDLITISYLNEKTEQWEDYIIEDKQALLAAKEWCKENIVPVLGKGFQPRLTVAVFFSRTIEFWSIRDGQKSLLITIDLKSLLKDSSDDKIRELVKLLGAKKEVK
jgi:hypothetical protein